MNHYIIDYRVKASSLLKSFLQKLPQDRLGAQDGIKDVQQHAFYRPLDWQLLEQRQLTPPYKPQVASDRDLANIDELFTKEEVLLTPESPTTLNRLHHNEFDGFEYVNPLILSEEMPV